MQCSSRAGQLSQNARHALCPPHYAASCEGKSGCHKPVSKRCHKANYHCVDGCVTSRASVVTSGPVAHHGWQWVALPGRDTPPAQRPSTLAARHSPYPTPLPLVPRRKHFCLVRPPAIFGWAGHLWKGWSCSDKWLRCGAGFQRCAPLLACVATCSKLSQQLPLLPGHLSAGQADHALR